MGVPARGSITTHPYRNIGYNGGSLYGMPAFIQGIPNFFSDSVINLDGIVPIFNMLEPITISHAVLTPPLTGRRQSRRKKAPGCRTVFVGNLPEKITEEIIKEAFKICGPISIVRMSRNNFCHIRFENMESVDQAVLLSDFNIRIDESEDPAYNGTLQVNYAIARDDNHYYECRQQARRREAHERRRLREAFHTPPNSSFL